MLKKIKNNKSLLLIILCFLIFIFSFFVHWYPIHKKGYPPSISAEIMVLARNLALTGEYKSQDKIGTVLTSDLIKEKGDYSVEGNKLTPILYGYLFKLFGFNQQLPLYISLILFSLTSIILFLLTYKLFNLTIALIQTLIFNLLPFISYASVYYGAYEWAIFFFSLGLFFYLIQIFYKKDNYFLLFVVGIFFTLAFTARNAYLLTIIAFLFYELIKFRNLKRLIILLVPLIFGWALYTLPDYFNGIVNLFLTPSPKFLGQFGHLFPDAYTFYFEKTNFLKNLIPSGPNDLSFLMSQNQPLGFLNIFLMYFSSFIFYPTELLKMVISGGPLIIFLLIYGIKELIFKKRELANFFLYWFIILYILNIYFRTNNWDHFLEIVFPISLLIALGGYKIIEIISNNKKIWKILLYLSLIGHMFYANWWMFHEEYDTSNMVIIKKMATCINNQSIEGQEVIAVDLHPEFPDYLNYFTDKSYIRSNPRPLRNF